MACKTALWLDLSLYSRSDWNRIRITLPKGGLWHQARPPAGGRQVSREVAIKSCPICGEENSPKAGSCAKCGFVLDLTRSAWPEYPTIEVPEPTDAPDWPSWPEVEIPDQPAESLTDAALAIEDAEKPAEIHTAGAGYASMTAGPTTEVLTDVAQVAFVTKPGTIEKSGSLDIAAFMTVLQTEESVEAQLAALGQLAKLDKSSDELVKALVLVEERHPLVPVRKEASKLLRSPVHQQYLERYRPQVKRAAPKTL